MKQFFLGVLSLTFCQVSCHIVCSWASANLSISLCTLDDSFLACLDFYFCRTIIMSHCACNYDKVHNRVAALLLYVLYVLTCHLAYYANASFVQLFSTLLYHSIANTTIIFVLLVQV